MFAADDDEAKQIMAQFEEDKQAQGKKKHKRGKQHQEDV